MAITEINYTPFANGDERLTIRNGINGLGSSVNALSVETKTAIEALEEKSQEGWKDLLCPFMYAKGRGTAEPIWKDMGNGIYAYHFIDGNELFTSYHIGHDYKRNTKIYPHIHFLVDTPMTAGQVVTWQFSYLSAERDDIGSGDSLTATPTIQTMTYTATGLEVAGKHIVLECSDTQAFAISNPDAIVLMDWIMVTTNATGRVFGLTADLHYQFDRDGTLNKTPDYYA